MVNSQLIHEVTDAFKLDLRVDKIPSVIPVCEVNPKHNKSQICKFVTKTTTGTLSIMQTPTDQDFYLTGCTLSFSKDAACDMATGHLFIQCISDGAIQVLCGLAILTTTAERDTISVQFRNPIKCDRNTAIQSVGTFAAGNCSRSATITGFIDEII